MVDGQFKDIKPGKGMRYDQIGSEVKPGIQNIIMKILSDKTYPNDWKFAIMKTLYKRGEKSNVENYCLISLLSIPNKI